MGVYMRPDVYVERVGSGAEPIKAQGTAVAGFVGIARRGEIGKAVLVTSWTDFIDKFARGLDTPFMVNSDLAYAVYGYFQNGGGLAYIVRVASPNAQKASVTVPTSSGVKFSAKDEGVWGNKLSVEVTSEDDALTVTVKYDGEVVEVFTGLNNDEYSENYYLSNINGKSRFITVALGTLAVGKGTMTDGADGITDISDADYTGAKGQQATGAKDYKHWIWRRM